MKYEIIKEIENGDYRYFTTSTFYNPLALEKAQSLMKFVIININQHYFHGERGKYLRGYIFMHNQYNRTPHFHLIIKNNKQFDKHKNKYGHDFEHVYKEILTTTPRYYSSKYKDVFKEDGLHVREYNPCTEEDNFSDVKYGMKEFYWPQNGYDCYSILTKDGFVDFCN